MKKMPHNSASRSRDKHRSSSSGSNESHSSSISQTQNLNSTKEHEGQHSIVLPRSKVTLTVEEILADYETGYKSRIASLIGRKEVLSGKAKFGIFGDGKEAPQLAMSRAFQNGDLRAGYYRDQTFMFASGMSTLEGFFAQLYANTDPIAEPASAGRMMNAHFSTPFVDEHSKFKDLTKCKNSSSDISPTAGQMARALGLAYASKLYRNEKSLKKVSAGFSDNGNEIAFATIGDASTSEGIFFEAMNAAGVLQVPLLMSVWDDGYGISVPRAFQTTKGSISEALAGFGSELEKEGFIIERVKAWDYPSLVDTYLTVAWQVRRTHKPALIHVTDVTQPQGHSTSGSHERYKSDERLQWEKDYCCMAKMRQWILAQKFTDESTLEKLEERCKQEVEQAKKQAWESYQAPIAKEFDEGLALLRSVMAAFERLQHEGQFSEPQASQSTVQTFEKLKQELAEIIRNAERLRTGTLFRRQIQAALHRCEFLLMRLSSLTSSSPLSSSLTIDASLLQKFSVHLATQRKLNHSRFNSHLVSESAESPLLRQSIAPVYDDSEPVDGRVVLLKCFEKHFESNPRFFALGEDVGKLGDVNLVFEGLNAKFGDLRVTDTGIREASILGQGIGCALRGLRPLVDIQYLDYLLYALQVMSDDLATLHYRTRGTQKCPVIVRTKGHRLEGIWHTGSPIAMILAAVRGLYVCVPRNMTQAAGMYNVLLQSDNPALVIEVLNGYRLKERVPANISDFQVALGVPEILRPGSDLTLVTYGACCRIALDAADFLQNHFDLSVEVIDVQTLLPFDRFGLIKESLRKTNAVLFLDEDVPGGATAYMMREVLETQQAFDLLDLAPRTLTAQPNRAAYASDGDYFCKPSAENVIETVCAMFRENYPRRFASSPSQTQTLWQSSPD